MTALYQNITGSPKQRSAAHLVGYRTLQDAQFRCLKKEGFAYPVHPYIDTDSRNPIVGAADTQWLAPLNSHDVTRRARVLAALPPALRREMMKRSRYDSSPVTAKKYGAALELCQRLHPESDEAEYPPGYDLVGPYHSMVESVDKQLASYQKDYTGCMRRAGFVVRSYPDLGKRIQQRIPDGPSTVTAAGRPVAAKWHAALVYESKAVRADAGCRREAHDVGYTLLKPKLEDFVRAHGSPLARLGAEWRARQKKAALVPGSSVESLRCAYTLRFRTWRRRDDARRCRRHDVAAA